MFTIRNFVDDIVKNTVDQIKYRESITLGEIKTDNGDGTYGVEISQSGKTYPNVETAHYGDTFTVGEIAIITYEYGNREMPRIWGHAKKIAQEPVEVEVDYSSSGGDPITTVTTLDAYLKTSNSAYLEGKIELSSGAGNCTRRGFKYGLTSAYGSDTHNDGDYGAGYFNKQITGLDANETYHYQAYVLDANSDEQVGEDKVMTTSVLTHKIYVVYEDFTTSKIYINSYDSDGNYLTQWEIETTELYYGEDVLCVDINDNVYTITGDNHSIKKRNSSGTLTLTKTEANYIYNIAVGPDGYIYTLEFDSAFNNGYISKRNASDLVSVDTLVIDASGSKSYNGLAIDSNSNFYITNDTNDRYEKWTWGGGQIATRASTNPMDDNGLGIAGTILGTVDGGTHPITIPLALDEDETDGVLDDITKPTKVGTILGYLLFAGRDDSNNRWLGKYGSDLTKVWTVQLASSTNFGWASISAYPF